MTVTFNTHVVPAGQIYVTASPGNGGIATLVSPANNPHGLIIRTLTLNVSEAGVNIYANPTPPTSATDFTTRMVFEFSTASGADSATLPYELYIYPGHGVYATQSGSIGNVFMTYDPVVPAAAA